MSWRSRLSWLGRRRERLRLLSEAYAAWEVEDAEFGLAAERFTGRMAGFVHTARVVGQTEENQLWTQTHEEIAPVIEALKRQTLRC